MRCTLAVVVSLLLSACVSSIETEIENPDTRLAISDANRDVTAQTNVNTQQLAFPIAEESVYQQHCAICHLESGQGVPGAFPNLDSRLQQWAQTDAGRSYLVGVLANGLYGSILVDGVQYAGAMPGLSHSLNEDEMAALLNYILIKFSGGEAIFSPSTVATTLAAIGRKPSLSLRPE